MLQQKIATIKEYEQLTLFPVAIHASLTASPGIEVRSQEEKKMKGIYGLNSSESSQNYSRIGLLTKMLLEAYPTEPLIKKYSTWSQLVTPLHHRLSYRLVVSKRYFKDIGFSLLPRPSGTSTGRNGKKNHVVGRLDEWGGSSNPFRGTEIGKVRCASFEEWMMGFPIGWTELTRSETP
jgi:hypothetical protein